MKKKNAALKILNSYSNNKVPAKDIDKVLKEYKEELENQGDFDSLQKVNGYFTGRVLTEEIFNTFLWNSALAQDGYRVLK